MWLTLIYINLLVLSSLYNVAYTNIHQSISIIILIYFSSVVSIPCVSCWCPYYAADTVVSIFELIQRCAATITYDWVRLKIYKHIELFLMQRLKIVIV